MARYERYWIAYGATLERSFNCKISPVYTHQTRHTNRNTSNLEQKHATRFIRHISSPSPATCNSSIICCDKDKQIVKMDNLTITTTSPDHEQHTAIVDIFILYLSYLYRFYFWCPNLTTTITIGGTSKF